MRPTTPGFGPSVTVRFSWPESEPRNAIWVPTAPTICRRTFPDVSTPSWIWMNPFRLMTSPIVICACTVALT